VERYDAQLAYTLFFDRIYNLEKQVRRPDGQRAADAESAPLLQSSLDTDAIFRRALDAELEKICSFYETKELELFGEVGEVIKDEAAYAADTDGVNMDHVSETVIKTRALSFGSRPRTASTFGNSGFGRDRRASAVSEDIEEEDEEDGDSDYEAQQESAAVGSRRPSRSQDPRRDSVDCSDGRSSELGDSRFLGDSRLMGSEFRSGFHDDHFPDPRLLDLYNAGVSLKKRAISVYVSLCELKSYIQLNKTGFSKALKKYDKILDRNLRREYMTTAVSPAYPFTDSTMQRLNDNIAKIEKIYADVVTHGDMSLARRELRLHLREHVVWERNTVWREMIGIERKAQAANMGIRRTLLGGDQDPATAQRQGDELEIRTKELATPLGRWRLPEWLFSLTFATLLVIVAVFIILLSVPIMDKPEQQNCLAMLVFVSLLWATEVGTIRLVHLGSVAKLDTPRLFHSLSLPCLFPSSSSFSALCGRTRNPTHG